MERYEGSNCLSGPCALATPSVPSLLLPTPRYQGILQNMNSSFVYDLHAPRTARPTSRNQLVPNQEYLVQSYSLRFPHKILPPIALTSKPGRPPMSMEQALERPIRQLSSLLVDYNDLEIFNCGLQQIRLKITWPGYSEYIENIPLGPQGVQTRAGLLVAVARAYDNFFRTVTAKRCKTKGSNSEWSITAKPHRYNLGNLVPLALKHYGADVFQAEVLVHERSAMQ
ncbi:hypothetical protein BD414DRAFT_283333 [Trametes punicea]|nr:hypothetical protein BD414DRAFT_283333 [Trametes punicea]